MRLRSTAVKVAARHLVEIAWRYDVGKYNPSLA